MILDEAPMRALSRRFGLAALLPPVRDIALSKWLTRPFARVAIAANLVNVIARKHCAYEADHDPDQKRHAPAPAFEGCLRQYLCHDCGNTRAQQDAGAKAKIVVPPR
jgi:hypothetical protein